MIPQVAARYKTQSSDTSIEIERLQFEGFRKFPLWKKADFISSLTQAVLELCLIGIRDKYPQASPAKVRCEFARRTLEPEIASNACNQESTQSLTIADPISLALVVAGILDALGIPYLVGGSLASSLLGEPRSTADIDLVADLRSSQVRAFLEAVQPDFYVSEDAVREAISYQSSFNLLHQATMSKIDIFILKHQTFAQSEFSRRRPKVVRLDPEQSLFLPTPEDIILQKLMWYRMGGGVSDKQWRDILGVMKLQGEDLDKEYLWHWAASLNLAELLDRSLGEAGLA